MIGDESDVMCCFCGETIIETLLDPCELAVTTQWMLLEDERLTQQWFCHAESFKEKMDIKASGSAYFADPTWRGTIEDDV